MVSAKNEAQMPRASREMSEWAESDAAIEAVEKCVAAHSGDEGDAALGSVEGRIALEVFRQAGRPRLDGNPHKTGNAPRRQVRLPEEMNEALDDYAAAHHMNASEVIREALRRFLSNDAA